MKFSLEIVPNGFYARSKLGAFKNVSIQFIVAFLAMAYTYSDVEIEETLDEMGLVLQNLRDFDDLRDGWFKVITVPSFLFRSQQSTRECSRI
jgi:hypothetical protein